MATPRGTRGAGGSNRHISNTNRRTSGSRRTTASHASTRGESEYRRSEDARYAADVRRSAVTDLSSSSYANSRRAAAAERSAAGARRSASRGGARPASTMEQVRQRRRRQKARRARQRMMLKLAMLGVCVLIAWVAMHFILKGAVEKVISDDTHIAEGITIDSLDVGGMTREQAANAVEAYVEDLSNLELNCTTADGSVALPLNLFGFQLQDTTARELAEQAYTYGREGSVIKRYRQIKKLKKGTVDIDAQFTIDEAATAQALSAHCKIVEGAAVNAQIVHNGGSRVVTESKNGIVVDTVTSTKQIKDLISDPNWEKKTTTMEVATYEAEPEITTEMLNKLSDELGSYYTQYEGLSAKMQNVENGASFINGSYVLPGEEFDANAAMEPYTEENGYTEGRSFNSGQVEETIGGGICQVSTTLYNAVLFSELEVVERSCHSMLINYVEPGRDAAIADDVKNFVFRNNTDNPIYIEAYTEDGYLHFYIWGVEYRDSNRRIEYYSDITSREESKIKYVADYDKPFGSKETTTYGYDGVEATLYKNIYIDDVLTDTELVNYSSYNLVNAIVVVGLDTENEEARKRLGNAILEQDEDVILSYLY